MDSSQSSPERSSFVSLPLDHEMCFPFDSCHPHELGELEIIFGVSAVEALRSGRSHSATMCRPGCSCISI